MKVRKLNYFSFVPCRRQRRLDVRPKRSIKFSQQSWKDKEIKRRNEGAQTQQFFFCALPPPAQT
jgi:hypothetical protein